MKKDDASGFTILEMLVVIGIMGLLIALLMPMLRGVRAESHSMQCLSNLRQIFLAVESYRQTTDDLLPYAQLLPTPMQSGPEGGLNGALQYLLPQDSEIYRCPVDYSQDADDLNTSYCYGPGAFMAFWLSQLGVQPQYSDVSPYELCRQAARHVTQLYEIGFLRTFPLLSDSQPRHTIGNRLPQNVVFLDGSARPRKPKDVIVNPGEVPSWLGDGSGQGHGDPTPGTQGLIEHGPGFDRDS